MFVLEGVSCRQKRATCAQNWGSSRFQLTSVFCNRKGLIVLKIGALQYNMIQRYLQIEKCNLCSKAGFFKTPSYNSIIQTEKGKLCPKLGLFETSSYKCILQTEKGKFCLKLRLFKISLLQRYFVVHKAIISAKIGAFYNPTL